MGLESTKTTSFFFDKWVYLDLNYHTLKIIAMGSSGRCGLIGLISFVTVQGFPDCRLSGIPGEMGIALHYRKFHGDLGDIL